MQDWDSACLLLALLVTAYGRLKLIGADGGDFWKLVEAVAAIELHRNVKFEIVKRAEDVKGFKILPKRWIVERIQLEDW